MRAASARAAVAVAPDADDRALLDEVVGYYHETLKQVPEALAYLERRGLAHPEMIDAFPARLCQPHARLPAAGKREGRHRASRRPERLGLYARAATSTSTAAW